jgi:hypothetical protein
VRATNPQVVPPAGNEHVAHPHSPRRRTVPAGVPNADHLTNPARRAYYDYLLVLHPNEEDALLMVNVTADSVKAGYVICQVRVKQVAYFITATELKRSLGWPACFIAGTARTSPSALIDIKCLIEIHFVRPYPSNNRPCLLQNSVLSGL